MGPLRQRPEISSRVSTPGVAIGLAWTQAGGAILFIEATAMKGNRGMILTGQLGDVMKESATAALSFIRTNAARLSIEDSFLKITNFISMSLKAQSQKTAPLQGLRCLLHSPLL